MIKPVKLPKLLYKYQAFSPRLLDMLVADELYYSDPGDFNDPLDADPRLRRTFPTYSWSRSTAIYASNGF